MNNIKSYFRLLLTLYVSFLSPLSFANDLFIGVHVAEAEINDYRMNLDKANDIGLKVIRVPVDWNALEPQRGRYADYYLDEIKSRVAHAHSLGQRVVMMFSQSPAWANGHHSPPYPPLPNYNQNYANAMAYLHGQLIDQNDAFIIDKSTILAWEVWNEPNVLEFWSPDNTQARPGTFVLMPLDRAEEYAMLLATAYDTMKRLYPEVTILGGSLASADTDYLKAIYKSFNDHFGGSVKFDHLSLHPYTRVDESGGSVAANPHYSRAQYPDQCNADDQLAPPWCFKQGVENVRSVLDAYGDIEKQIWFTEFGVSSSSAWGGGGSEEEQKEHLKRALDILGDWTLNGDAMKVPVAIIYCLQDGSDLFGLVDSNGNDKQVVSELQPRLDDTGQLITGIQNPDVPKLISPVDNTRVGRGTQTYKWQAASGADSYLLWVNNYTAHGDMSPRVARTYSSEDVCNRGSPGVCAVTPPEILYEGTAEWWITAYINGGILVSKADAFIVNLNPWAHDGT